MRYVFIVNPVAGKGKAPEIVLPQLEKYFEGRDDCTVYVTKSQGDTKKLAVKEAQKGDKVRIYACGGEGTCFDVLNGVFGYDNVEIGVIPCGSANDFLKYYGEKELFFDIKEMVEGTAVDIDIIKADEFYCINGCSVGMDAVVADDMRIFKGWPLVSGSMAYKLAIVKNFVSKIGANLKITINGKLKCIKNCLFVVCANGPVYGGGYKSAPYAVPDDHKLDFTIVETISKLKVPGFLKLYEKGKHDGLPYCELGNCESLEIEADKPIPINLDGEIIHRARIKFEVMKNAAKFVLPKKIANKILVKA
ncbi:MAG: YegS/Rv2252/BmrU family lipid kinase [Clostridiales bacterium]|nr:YegS/Rv2252/BmrU family lipid kinase [Candidatus Equinaster intestinalis]